MKALYTPSPQILRNYAHVLVNFALNSGEGVKAGEVVQCQVPDVAKALGLELQNTLLEAGAHPLMRLLPTGFDRDYYLKANQAQLTFFPEEYYLARAKLLDHSISIIADVDPRELEDVPMDRIMTARNARDPFRRMLISKETKGEFTWTLGLWGVEAKAKEVGLTLEEYWDQIIKACYLDSNDPVAEWKALHVVQERIKKDLNSLSIESVHATGPDMDITVRLGKERLWQGGSGRNVPSFEFFTSPDWRGTEGHIFFNQPLYRYGQVVRDISLEFRQGHVVKGHAKVGNSVLQEMLKTKNADKIGEYSLTDKRMSRITHTMAETLFDENIGGPFGNTHLAIGMAYKDCYRGEADRLTREEWEELGYNDSAEHTDMVSTTDRTVVATLTDGSEVVLYKDGMFTCYAG
jgi:aminopeptidase